MKSGTILYLPSPSFRKIDVNATVENLQANPPSGPFIVFSEHSGWKEALKPTHFETLTIAPDSLSQIHLNPTCGISNAVWVYGMRLAKKYGLTHALYLEADCRVARVGWDAVIFHEFFNLPFPPIAAGTLISWNGCNGGLEYLRRIQTLISAHAADPCPVLAYGSFPMENRPCNPCLFPNGACSVLDVEWMHELFDGFRSMMMIVLGEGMEGKAWDYQIGQKLREKFGNEVPDVLAHLKTVCSTYGDLAISVEDKLRMLREHNVLAAHQFKGKEKP